jgi:uncharacterized protein YcbK (DUF882 family)
MKGFLDRLDPSLLSKLDELEKRCRFELTVTSGRRSPEHNADPKVGGVKDSAHLPDENDRGHAVDLEALESWKRFQIVYHALALGFIRIGVGRTFVHLDNSTTLPQHVLWHYYPKET